MAVWIKVGLKNETRSQLGQMRQDIAATAQASASLFNTTDADALRTSIQGITTELRQLSTSMQQHSSAAKVLRDQSDAASELRATTQQQITINQAASTSLGDVGMAALNAYLRFRMLNTAMQGGKYLWKEHREATVAGGAAIGGIAVVAATAFGGLLLLQAGFSAVRAVAQSVSDTIDFMEEHGVNNIRELTDASDNLAAAWFNLKRAALESDMIKQLTTAAAEGLNDTAGVVRLVQELVVDLKKDMDFRDILGSWDKMKDAEGWRPLGKSLHAIGEDTISWLALVDARAKALQGILNWTGIKADRTPIKQANERTLADSQQADLKKWMKEFEKKESADALDRDRKKYTSIAQVTAAIAQQKQELLKLADGTEGSAARIAAKKKELADSEKQRNALISTQTQLIERVDQLERKRSDDAIKGWADQKESIHDVKMAQDEIIDNLNSIRQKEELNQAVIDDANRRWQALEQRKLKIIQDRTKAEQEYQQTLEAVAKINAEFVKGKADAIKAAAEQATQALRSAIAEAKGVLNPEQSLTDEARGQFAPRDVAKELIAARQKKAREEHIGKNRHRVDLEGDAWGDSRKEQKENQRRFDRELAKINADEKKKALRQIRAGGRGNVPAVDEGEVRTIRDQMLMDRADKAVKGGRMSWAQRDALKDNLAEERAKWDQQRANANAVGAMQGLLGKQPRDKPGFNPMQQMGTNPAEQAMAQGFGQFGNMANAQMQWGQQITATADSARAEAAKATAMFQQMMRQSAANGTRLRATQGTLKQ